MTKLTCVYSMHTGQTERMCDMTCVSTCRATRMSEMLTSETAASRIQKVVRVHGTAKPYCHCHYLGAWNSSCHLIPSFLFLALSCRAFSRILALRNIRRFLPVARPGQSTLPEVLRGSSHGRMRVVLQWLARRGPNVPQNLDHRSPSCQPYRRPHGQRRDSRREAAGPYYCILCVYGLCPRERGACHSAPSLVHTGSLRTHRVARRWLVLFCAVRFQLDNVDSTATLTVPSRSQARLPSPPLWPSSPWQELSLEPT